MKPNLLMFDLDGTLVDSVPDLSRAVDAMLEDIGHTKVGSDQVRLWVGNGATMLVRRALSQSMVPGFIEDALFENAVQRFFYHYQQVNGTNSSLFPGVLDTVRRLREIVPYMAVVTNKPAQFTLPLLERLDLQTFDLIVSGDTLSAKKPDPAQLLYCLKTFACQQHDALMVGDSVNDIKAARAANMPSVCVTYGYHQGEDLSAQQPDFLIEHFSALLDIIV